MTAAPPLQRYALLLCLLASGALAPGCDSELTEPAPSVEVGAVSTTGAYASGPISRWYNTSSFAYRDTLKSVLANLAGAKKAIYAMASAPNGAWILSIYRGYYYGGALPSGMRDAVRSVLRRGETVMAMSINASNGWVVVGESSYSTGGPVPQAAKNKLAYYFDRGWGIRDVDITDQGYVILGSGSLASYWNVDADLRRYLYDRHASRRTVQQVEIGFDGRWAAVAGQEPAHEGLSSQLAGRLESSAKNQVHVSRLMIGPGSSYVLYSHGKTDPTPGNTIEAIEYGVAGEDNLWERMDAIGLPGLSIAIIEDNEVKYARGYGVVKAGGNEHVLATTPFDMASLSKYIGALTMMRLDSDSRYDFDVDDSVVDSARTHGLISDWLYEGTHHRLRYGIPDVDISSQLTIAHFLRHQSDFVRTGGSPGFTSTRKLSGVDTLDLMLGYQCGTIFCGYYGDKFAWSAGGAGKVGYRYDSVNYLMPQAVAEEVTGKEAHQLAHEYFFGPMGLTRISGDVHSQVTADTAWPHNSNGPRSSRTYYPWTFAGGIMASTSDYAEMMILALNEGRDSSGVQRLPAAAVQRMLQVQNGSVGFGLFADSTTNITETNDNRFKHSGAHGSRARSYMCGNPTRDGGIVIAFNADIGDGPDANTSNDTNDLRRYIVDQFMDAVGWPGDCL